MEVSEKMEIPHWIIHFNLVGGFNPSEKYARQMGVYYSQ
jgi:hypothetical protein